MAEFELRLKYTNAPTKAAVHVLALLFPLWGIATPLALVLFTVLLLRLPSNIPILYALVLIVVMVLIITSCTALALICDDDEIRVSKDGLRFPIRFLPSLRFVGQHSWQELVALKLRWNRQEIFSPDDKVRKIERAEFLKLHWNRQETFSADETLDFVFQDGGYARLKLGQIEMAELEQFFIAFEACAYKCERDADIPDFERAIQCRKQGSLYSFTELWEKSLANKFSGATFTPLEPNTLLQSGRYQILRQLAFGGFSAIYLARPQAGGFVVLKESSFPQTDDVQSKAAELFRRESTLLGKLDHPNIAKVHDYFIENARHYIVLQHIEGIDLGRLVMQSGPQPAETVVNWLRQLVPALQYLHGQSPPIVHRDVTPDNLLLKPDGTLIVIDFGAAKEIVGNFTGTIIGKHAYIAPEQFKGKPSSKSDVYSLGATTYFLLTGKPPEPLTPSCSKEQLNSVPQDLSDLVLKCTSMDESERPDCAAILDQLSPKELTVAETR